LVISSVFMGRSVVFKMPVIKKSRTTIIPYNCIIE
jgi:hypothetical protein